MISHNNSRKTSTAVFKSTRLLVQLRDQSRYLHYSVRTEEVYVYWVKKFIHFHQKRHLRNMGQGQAEAFLTHMAVERKESVSIHRQTLSALFFSTRRCWGLSCLGWMSWRDRYRKSVFQWCSLPQPGY
jgi:Phage integrase, N-terminal SAM-like domain